MNFSAPEHKLAVLAKIARALNERQLTWAVGASLLLYLKGIVPDFHDIDLMVAEADVAQVQQALSALGALQPKNPDAHYRTRTFLEFAVEGVEVDVIAGFVILSGGEEHYFPLRAENIRDRAVVGGEVIPLQTLAEWRSYYALMGRGEKVALIDRHLAVF